MSPVQTRTEQVTMPRLTSIDLCMNASRVCTYRTLFALITVAAFIANFHQAFSALLVSMLCICSHRSHMRMRWPQNRFGSYMIKRLSSYLACLGRFNCKSVSCLVKWFQPVLMYDLLFDCCYVVYSFTCFSLACVLIQDKTGVPPTQQRLIFGLDALEDDMKYRKLSDDNIQTNDELTMVLR